MLPYFVPSHHTIQDTSPWHMPEPVTQRSRDKYLLFSRLIVYQLWHSDQIHCTKFTPKSLEDNRTEARRIPTTM